MSSSGVGARVAWSIQSSQVAKDLSNLLDDVGFRRVDFAAGERLREAALASYASARAEGRVEVQSLPSSHALAAALQESLQSTDPAANLTLFMQDSERKGSYELSTATFLRHAARLLAYDGNCIFVTLSGEEHGRLLDREDVPGQAVTYHLESW